MNIAKKLRVIIYFILSFFITQAFGQKNMPVLDPNTWVTDQAGIIKNESVISSKLKDWEAKYKTGAEIVVVTIKDLEDYDKADYAVNLATKYGIGKAGANNGILILIAPNQGKHGQWFIATGYGVEGVLPDAKCKEIGESVLNNNNVREEARNGNFDPFILGVIDEIHNILSPAYNQEMKDQVAAWEKAQKEQADKESQKRYESFINYLQVYGLFFLVISIMFIIARFIVRKIKARKNAKENFYKIQSDIQFHVGWAIPNLNSYIKTYPKPFKDSIQNVKTAENSLKSYEDIKLPFSLKKRLSYVKEMTEYYRHVTSSLEYLEGKLNEYDRLQDGIKKLKNNKYIIDNADNFKVKEFHNLTIYNENNISEAQLITNFKKANEVGRELVYVAETIQEMKRVKDENRDLILNNKWLSSADSILEWEQKINVLTISVSPDGIKDTKTKFCDIYDSFKKDVNIKKEIDSYTFDENKHRELQNKSNEIIKYLHIDFHNYMYLDKLVILNQEIENYKKSETVKSHWHEVKVKFQYFKEFAKAHVDSYEQLLNSKREFDGAKKSIEKYHKDIAEKIKNKDSMFSKSGVGFRTKSDYDTLKATFLLLAAENILFHNSADILTKSNSINYQLDGLISKAKRNHDDYNNSTSCSSSYYGGYSSSSSSSSYDSSFSSSSFGGGSFGGGGGGGDF